MLKFFYVSCLFFETGQKTRERSTRKDGMGECKCKIFFPGLFIPSLQLKVCYCCMLMLYKGRTKLEFISVTFFAKTKGCFTHEAKLGDICLCDICFIKCFDDRQIFCVTNVAGICCTTRVPNSETFACVTFASSNVLTIVKSFVWQMLPEFVEQQGCQTRRHLPVWHLLHQMFWRSSTLLCDKCCRNLLYNKGAKLGNICETLLKCDMMFDNKFP